jgi:hypothetical protein
MKARLAIALALAISGFAIQAHAHHSFAAEFDINQPVRLMGKVTRIEWSNPHTYFYIDVVDTSGKTTNWAIEGPSPGALSRRAWQKGDLKVGDTVVVEGYRAKNGSNTANGRRVTLPDGRRLYGTDQGNLPATGTNK